MPFPRGNSWSGEIVVVGTKKPPIPFGTEV